MASGKTIYFSKLVDGGVSLYMSDVEGVLPSRWFAMDYRMPRIGIPENYALSLFVDAAIDKAFQKKLFEVEDMAGFIKIAQERGYIALSEDEEKAMVAPSRTKETLLAILKGGNESKIRDLFNSADKKRALEIAVSNVNVLSLETVHLVEEILGMAITEE